jgi:tetratricopeptide (TPR) repeat protein
MAKTKDAWAAFKPEGKAPDFAGDKLQKAWKELHAGDGEPFPDEKRAAALLKAAGKAAPKGLDAKATAGALQQAWRDFHEGNFRAAFEAGEKLGPVGASVAVKALGIHATYLVEDEAEQESRYQRAAALAEAAVKALPDEANSHYRHAFALGRYSQKLSIAKALKMGLAGKVKSSLDAALALAPKHAEARTALGLYHAEIVGKVGGMLAKFTYGASAGEAEKQLKEALKLTPESPIAWIEFGNAQLLLHGAKGEDDAAAAFAKAAKLKPRDAMERLDAEWAKAQLA